MENELVQPGNPRSDISQPPDSSEQQEVCREGLDAYAQGNYKDAIGKLSRGLQDDHSNWRAMCCLALSYCHNLHFKSAHATFAYLVEHCRDDDIQSRCRRSLESLQQAASSGLISLESEPDPETDELPVLPDSASGIDGATAANSQSVQAPALTEEEQRKYRKWGVNTYLDEKYDKAIEYLEAGLAGDVQDGDARFCLGMSYFKVGNYQSARTIFEALVNDSPDNKVRARARQALDSVHSAETEPPPALAASQAADVTSPKRKKQADKATPRLVLHDEENAAPLQTARKTQPLAIVVLALCLAGLAYYGGTLMLPSIYQSVLLPPHTSGDSVQTFGALAGINGSTVQIPASNQATLYGVYYAKPKSSRVVILNPSLPNHLAFRKKLAQALLDAGFSVLVYDGYGTGRSGGRVTWQGLGNDGRFAYDALIGKFRYNGPDISSYGNSLASASTIITACTNNHGPLVVENPFASLPQLVRARLPLLAIFPDAVCPQPQLNMNALLSSHDHPHGPLLVLITGDALVPADEGQSVFASATEPKQWQSSPGSGEQTRIDAIVKFFSNN